MLRLRSVLASRLLNKSLQKRMYASSSLSKDAKNEEDKAIEPKFSKKQKLIGQKARIQKLDEFTDVFVKELPKLPDDDELRTLFGSTLIRDPLNTKSIEEMEDENDRTSREANKFRKIIYDEGELDNSNLTKPPSKANPHPLDTSTLPPTHSRSLAAYVNHLPVLQALVDIGVNLFEPKLGQKLLRLDIEEDVKPRIAFLAQKIGVELEDIGSYLTRNPYLLFQKMGDLRNRVKYLENKKFSKDQIKKIVIEHRHWLNLDSRVIDSRLGWLQRQFQLSGDNLRNLITKEPRIIIFGIGPLQRLLLMFNNELEFGPGEIKKMVCEDPRLFMLEPHQVKSSFNYLSATMKMSNELIYGYPIALRCPVHEIRKRNEFLKRLELAQYDPELPNYISLRKLLHPSDKYFSETVCRKFLHDYENFLKTL